MKAPVRGRSIFLPHLIAALATIVYAIPATGQDMKPESLIVGDVILKGSRKVPGNDDTRLLKSRVGQRFSYEAVHDDVRALHATNRYCNVQARYVPRADGKVDVYFNVVDAPPSISEIRFEGVRHVKEEELRKVIGIKEAHPTNARLDSWIARIFNL